MSDESILLLVALGLVVGALGTLIGAGGGFLLTPVLLLVYPHASAQTISATSLAVVFANAASGTVAYARQGRVDYRSGRRFALAALPGAILGALAVGIVLRRVFDALMGLLLGALAIWLLVRRGAAPATTARPGTTHRRLVDRRGVVYGHGEHRAAAADGAEREPEERPGDERDQHYGLVVGSPARCQARMPPPMLSAVSRWWLRAVAHAIRDRWPEPQMNAIGLP